MAVSTIDRRFQAIRSPTLRVQIYFIGSMLECQKIHGAYAAEVAASTACLLVDGGKLARLYPVYYTTWIHTYCSICAAYGMQDVLNPTCHHHQLSRYGIQDCGRLSSEALEALWTLQARTIFLAQTSRREVNKSCSPASFTAVARLVNIGVR